MAVFTKQFPALILLRHRTVKCFICHLCSDDAKHGPLAHGKTTFRFHSHGFRCTARGRGSPNFPKWEILFPFWFRFHDSFLNGSLRSSYAWHQGKAARLLLPLYTYTCTVEDTLTM